MYAQSRNTLFSEHVFTQSHCKLPLHDTTLEIIITNTFRQFRLRYNS